VKTTTDEQVEIVQVDNLKNMVGLYNLNWLIPLALDKDIEIPTEIIDMH